ncbi:hypothetical protein XA68_11670 [Ophiocordyceps unilateralis]|uniref:Uncharacterized protein n=1 Tax=Ophiocordyceps unilateralis TaxID=268505 RepID=A0A2A9PG18_OPHUN|nr:hypothetical protein XA68_11670 [Ophiocordyceps unilateralis]
MSDDVYEPTIVACDQKQKKYSKRRTLVSPLYTRPPPTTRPRCISEIPGRRLRFQVEHLTQFPRWHRRTQAAFPRRGLGEMDRGWCDSGSFPATGYHGYALVGRIFSFFLQ